MSKLTTNTADLQAILDKVNALPDAGNSEPALQEKTATPATSSQTITPDSEFDGLSKVTVAAIPSNYEDVATETTAYTDLLPELSSVIDGLPDAGSGGGSGGAVETCMVTLNYAGPPLANAEGKICYTDETQTPKETLFTWGDSYKVIKGSMIRLYGDSWSYPISSGTNYTYVISYSSDVVYFITGDVTFSFA